MIQNLLPVRRELGLLNTFWDGNLSNVQQLSDQSDQLLDEAYIARLDKS
ncbi:hypothetical protein AVDCRST_MAG81-725 [uncultured Synechococcales cyanobacterium]|uniref:Uncharacterized protein n=1 Tax=uncultured Synechococcales cyanobacterium TaxID=1936017 RepID=A0A6J4UWW3_9CYAN|nr:hypothetical protein AVDCRST_MAG81-725 [uncultured Synechococcales cyanobacterium]